MDPKNVATEPISIFSELTVEQFNKQEAYYVYRYRYNGGGASQVWLSHGRSVLCQWHRNYHYVCAVTDWQFQKFQMVFFKAIPFINFVSYRYVVIDISSGPCTYGRLESEEGSVGHRTVPRLQHLLLPANPRPAVNPTVVENVFCGQISGIIVSALEHIIAPDVRYCMC